MKLTTQMSSRMNASQLVRASARTPVFNLGVLILAARYATSHLLSLKFKRDVKDFASDILGPRRNKLLNHTVTSMLWAGLSIPVLMHFDCARTRFVAGRRGLMMRIFSRSTLISVLLSFLGMSIYRILSFLIYDGTKDVLRGQSTTTRFLVEFIMTSIAGSATYPIDTLRRMYFLEPHSTKNLRISSKLFRGVWINFIRCFTQAFLHLVIKKAFMSSSKRQEPRHVSSSSSSSSSSQNNGYTTPNPSKYLRRRRGRRIAQT